MNYGQRLNILPELKVVLDTVTELTKILQPSSLSDPDIKLFEALGVARDQMEFVVGVLTRREPLSTQEPLPLPLALSPTAPTLPENMANWCDGCDNPNSSCTCPH